LKTTVLPNGITIETNTNHEVPDGSWKVLVEAGIGNDWYAPEEADDEVSDNAAGAGGE
jgi:hypothetical protein